MCQTRKSWNWIRNVIENYYCFENLNYWMKMTYKFLSARTASLQFSRTRDIRR